MNPPFHIPKECRLYTAAQSRAADRKTIEDFGIDGFTLMEIAANGAAKKIRALQGDRKNGLFLCGKGNNAGDALAVARYLLDDAAHSAAIYLLFGKSDLSTDTEKNLKLLETLKEKGATVTWVYEFIDINPVSFDYVVDGIFGTGLSSDLKNPLPDIIEKINGSNRPVYSMDLPSGLHADTGKIHGTCIRADVTYTFGTKKLGFYLNNAWRFTGKIDLIPLPFPSHVLENRAILLNRKLCQNLPQDTHAPRHKYDGGVVHIVAGSEGLTGAAIMSAKSAWKYGAGAVFLYAPKALLPVYEVALPQIIKIPLGEDKDRFFKEKHANAVLESLKNKKGVLLIGPGMGGEPETAIFTTTLLGRHQGEAIIDADAIRPWEDLKKIPSGIRKNWLLTPHTGEAKKYLEADFNDDYSRLDWASTFTDRFGCGLLMKGNPAYYIQAEMQPVLTDYDTSAFNRAGFGDVLAGAIAAYTSIEKSRATGTLRALFETYLTLTDLKKEKTIGPESLL